MGILSGYKRKTQKFDVDRFDFQKPFIWKLKNSIRFISEEGLQLSDDTGGFKIVGENVGERTQILKGKGKAVPLQAWSCPEASRKLRFPDFMRTAQDGGKVASLTHRPSLPPGNTPGSHFC